MTGRFATVLVVALVVLAGCSGGPATTTTSGGSPTDATTTTTSGESLNRVTVPSDLVPPGANERSIVQPRRLVQAHSAVLGSTPHRSTTTYTNLGVDASGVVDYELTAGEDGYVSNRTVREDGTSTAQLVYFDGQTVRVRDDTENGTTYQYASGPTRTTLQYTRPQRPAGQVFLFYTSLTGNLKATDFATINGQKVVKYRSTGMNETRFKQVRGALGVANATLEDVSVVAYVDRNGVIHDVEASLSVTTGEGDDRTFELDHRIRDFESASVSAPSWSDAVPAVNGSVAEDGRLVTLENTGSAPISNYTLGVAGNESAETTINETLAPGESLYAYVTTDGNETTLHVSETRPDVPADAVSLPRRTRVSVFLATDTAQISLGITTGPQNASSVRDPVDAHTEALSRNEYGGNQQSTIDGGDALGGGVDGDALASTDPVHPLVGHARIA